jgi:hypothetical protein
MVPLRSEGPLPSSLVGRPRARRWASQGRKWSSVGLKGHSFEPRRRFVENRRWRGLGTAPLAASAAPFDYANADYANMSEAKLWDLLVLPYTEPKKAKELGYKKLLGEETDADSAIRVWSDVISRKEGVPAATPDDEDEEEDEDEAM